MKTFKQFNETISVGKTVKMMHFYAAGNKVETVPVKIVDYVRKVGQKDRVVYKYKGKEYRLAVNIFKKRMVS